MKIRKINEEYKHTTDYIETYLGNWSDLKKELIQEYKKKWKTDNIKIKRLKSDTKGLYMYEVETF